MSFHALGALLPQVRLPRATLGSWPTPLDAVTVGGRTFLAKREDLSAEVYGGNKIRPLELVFGDAQEAGAERVWATGAYGSNHALATVLHAPRAGLRGGAILWPQPPSATARVNLRATVARADGLIFCPGLVTVPLAALQVKGPRAVVMPPGAATARWALGHAAGALELALQAREAGVGRIGAIVLPVGSTCTTVGLLVGTALAHHLGLWEAPRLVAVRVTPWPVTAAARIVRLALASAAALEALGGPRLGLSAERLRARLTVTGEALGRGYGHPTQAAWEAGARLLDAGTEVQRLTPAGPVATSELSSGSAPGSSERAPPLRTDTTYAGKAAAWLLRALGTDALPPGEAIGPVVFWMTKSAPPLPAPDLAREGRLPAAVRRWLGPP